MNRPFCSECLHYKAAAADASDECRHPESLGQVQANFIRKSNENLVGLRCVTMRLVGAKCGLEGKLFSPSTLPGLEKK